jgi:hypothetical protein
VNRPALFVGSSSEGQRVAEELQVLLDPVCEVELWTQGIFGLTQGTLESLVIALTRFDFALLILTADDLTVSRGTEKPAARDNVLFELGLFIGSLGRDRTFMLYDRTKPPALPSDLAGITAATFAPHASGNLGAALGASSTKIRNAIERLGVRNDKGLHTLENAAQRQKSDPLPIFRATFPDDLISRRATARNLLLIGLTMTRTVQAGSLFDIRHILQAGGKIRILVVDPTNDELMAAVSRHARHGINSGRVRRRIQETLDELTELQNSTRGDLEVRIASFIPTMGLNVIDADTADGLIVAQHYEHRPTAEAAPIICLKSADGMWYEHFAAEALRLWEDGTPWPLSAAQKLARSPRPDLQTYSDSSYKAA